MKKWSLRKADPDAAELLEKKCGLPRLCASVLAARGINTPEKAAKLFNYDEDRAGFALSDPFSIKDMKEAAEVILSAAEEEKQICVYGDFDCDGITSTAALCSYLECIGADVDYYINDRSEGFGMCESAVRKLAEEGTELIITVDNGISAVEEAKLCKELGITLVITDHHTPGEVLPEAAAVVDPHRVDCPSPYKELCGCGVVLKLIAAMDGGDYSAAMEQFGDLAAIATVADVVPLTGENREIVSKGLRYLENTENYGLLALMKTAGIKAPVSSNSAAFGLAPRLNASGRLGNAGDAVQLLLTDEPETARNIAERLDMLNSRRRAMEERIIGEVREMIEKDPLAAYKKVLVVYGENWHRGIIGIAASHLLERFGKPVFIISCEGEDARGSARAPEGFSVYEALSACSGCLDKFGGHKGAGGFSLLKEKIPEFDEKLQEYAGSFEHMPHYTLWADRAVSPEELSVPEVKSLSLLEPFGEGSRQPLMLIHGAAVTDIIPLSMGAHTKLRINYGGTVFNALMFGRSPEELPFGKGAVTDMLVYAGINSFGGRESVDLRAADIRIGNISQPKYFAAKEAYENYRISGKIPPALKERMVPERSDLAAVYTVIAKSGKISFDDIFAKLDREKIPFCKMMISIDIFEELGLIETDRFYETAEVIKDAEKNPVENSEIYKKVMSYEL